MADTYSNVVTLETLNTVYADIIERITAVTGVWDVKGDISWSSLMNLTSANGGDIWNITDDTGAPASVKIGSNVACKKAFISKIDPSKWDTYWMITSGVYDIAKNNKAGLIKIGSDIVPAAGTTASSVNIGLSLTSTSNNPNQAYINIPIASPNTYGLVNTTAQSFAGDKTFTGNVNINGTLTGTIEGAASMVRVNPVSDTSSPVRTASMKLVGAQSIGQGATSHKLYDIPMTIQAQSTGLKLAGGVTTKTLDLTANATIKSDVTVDTGANVSVKAGVTVNKALTVGTTDTGAINIKSGGSSDTTIIGPNNGTINLPANSATASMALVQKTAGTSDWLAYTNDSTPGTLVKRDDSGNFSAGTITANLSGTATQVSKGLTVVDNATTPAKAINSWVGNEAKTLTIAGSSPIISTATADKITLSHATSGPDTTRDTSKGDTSNQTPAFGDTFKALSATVNKYGHTTSLAEHTVKIPTLAASGSGEGSGTIGTITINGATTTFKHQKVNSSASTTTSNPGYSGTFTAIDSITLDNDKHVTSINTTTVTMPAAQSENKVGNTTSEVKLYLVGTTTTSTTAGNFEQSYTSKKGLYVTNGALTADVSGTFNGATVEGIADGVKISGKGSGTTNGSLEAKGINSLTSSTLTGSTGGLTITNETTNNGPGSISVVGSSTLSASSITSTTISGNKGLTINGSSTRAGTINIIGTTVDIGTDNKTTTITSTAANGSLNIEASTTLQGGKGLTIKNGDNTTNAAVLDVRGPETVTLKAGSKGLTITSDGSAAAATVTITGVDVDINNKINIDGNVDIDAALTITKALTIGASSTYTGAVSIKSGGSNATTIIGPDNGTINLPKNSDTAGYALVQDTLNTSSWKQYTDASTGNTLVKRNANGGFSAGTIIATLDGTATTANNVNVTVDGASTTTTRYLAAWSVTSSNTNTPAYGTSKATVNGKGELSATKVYNAVWNDLVDCIEVPADTKLEYGYAYGFDGKEYKKTVKKADKNYIGIHSDTYGMAMGQKEGKTVLNAAVAGFVLAYVDKPYEVGTPLVATSNGKLTKANLLARILHPERIIGTFWKIEKDDYWGEEEDKVEVKGRSWIKIL